MEESFLNNLDKDTFDTLLEETKMNVSYFNTKCMEVVNSYCSDLDNFMISLTEECISPNIDNPYYEAPLKRLQAYYLELSSRLYFIMSKLETVGVYADVSSNAYKEVYSKYYIELSSDKDEKGKAKSTVEELKTQANMKAQYHNVVSDIYDRAYKIIKSKVDSAKSMLDTLRRLISTRTVEMQLQEVE